MTMPITSAAANNADLTMPVIPASQNGDMTMPISLGNSDMTMPVNLATPNIDATMPVNVVSTPPGAVPGQRAQGGQLYSTGGYPAVDMTMPVSDPSENSGSLTGHILAQGWYDAPVEQRRGNFKVVLAMLVVLGLLVTVSLVFLFTVGDSFSDMVKGIAN
ncbi:hypothetical protein [Actinoplanes ianthinogenes]|nr:hypothetical protein [Actinoplanes ianthinogenes]